MNEWQTITMFPNIPNKVIYLNSMFFQLCLIFFFAWTRSALGTEGGIHSPSPLSKTTRLIFKIQMTFDNPA